MIVIVHRKLYFFLVVLGGQLLALSPSFAGDRLALLIGNSRYENATPLRNPENDIQLVQQSLEKAGFTIVKGRNLDANKTRRLIDYFISKARSLKNPTLLVYFAGHGVQFNKTNYLLPIDAPTDNRNSVKRVSINAYSLLKKLDSVSPRYSMLILDACRDDPFENATRGLKRGLSKINVKSSGKFNSRVIAYSTSIGKVASDGNAGTSPYASAFAESVLIPGLSIEGVFRRTRKLVNQRTKGEQVPWEDVSTYEKFIFIPKKGSVKLSISETEIFNFASMVNTAESYQRYIEKYPNGLFIKIALSKIDAINKDFSYRRKAEMFPILIARDSDFKSCMNNVGKNYSAASNMTYHLAKYRNQIVYVDINVPYRAIFCKKGRKVNYQAVRFLKGKGQDCNLGFWVLNGFQSEKVRCTDARRHLDKKFRFKSFIKNGGISFAMGEGSWTIPLGETDHYLFYDNVAEAIFDSASFYIRGLVRIKLKTQEFDQLIYFEPINPKEIGLTGKFQNTLNEVQNNKRTINIGSNP